MWQMALKLLKNNWKSLLVIVALTGGGVWLGTFITGSQLTRQALAFSEEKATLNAGFARQKSQWDNERLTAAGQYAEDLKAALAVQMAWQRKADALSQQLAEREVAHQKTVNDLKKRLKDAIESDGNAYTGIGPAGLQLWREALGYTGAEAISSGHGLSEAASGTAGHSTDATRTGGGLTPQGIISHSTEYGAWCLQLRERLQTLQDYYR